jgi:hypothetical protein
VGILAVERCMRLMRLLILAAAGVATAACASSTSPSHTLDSGVQGVTMVGPSCPVQPETTLCPDRPLANAKLTVTVQRSATVVATGRSDADGRFRIPLAPGTYVLHPANSSNSAVPPSASARPFLIHPHTYTEIRVNFDSGIR